MIPSGVLVVERYVVRCRANGCRLHEISTKDRCQAIANAHSLASQHQEITITRYDLPLSHALAT